MNTYDATDETEREREHERERLGTGFDGGLADYSSGGDVDDSGDAFPTMHRQHSDSFDAFRPELGRPHSHRTGMSTDDDLLLDSEQQAEAQRQRMQAGLVQGFDYDDDSGDDDGANEADSTAACIAPRPTAVPRLELLEGRQGSETTMRRRSVANSAPRAWQQRDTMSSALVAMPKLLKIRGASVNPDGALSNALGRGACGAVREVKGIADVAVKTLDVGCRDARESILRELAMMNAAQAAPDNSWFTHFVVPFSACHRDGTVYLPMERMSGSMSQFRGRPMPLSVVRHVARQVLSGLRFLHGMNLIHRDVKPCNILFNRQNAAVKIADFGLAMPLGSDDARPLNGSIKYMAPERLRNKDHPLSSDVWSAGIALAEMALGEHPFSAKLSLCSHSEERGTAEYWAMISLTDKKCINARKSIETNSNMDDSLKALLLGHMMTPVTQRSSCEQLLAHPFFTMHDLVADEHEAMAWFAREADRRY